MNLKQLYQEVYETDTTPTDEQLKVFKQLLPALPDNIFNAVFQHYVHKKAIETIANESGVSVHMVERWRKSGVAMMQVYAAASSDVEAKG